jgi:hypothetical protein
VPTHILAIYGRLQLTMNARRKKATITSLIIIKNTRDRNLSLRVNECILLRNVTGPFKKSIFNSLRAKDASRIYLYLIKYHPFPKKG